MPRSKTIWLDCDGVLLDYTSAFLEFTGLAPEVTVYDVTDYDLTKFFTTPDECYKAMNAFSLSEYWSTMMPLVLAHELEMLSIFGYEVNVLTQVTNPLARMPRIKNLALAFGNVFNEVHFTGYGECKLEYIWSLSLEEEDHILVEDSPTHLLDISKQNFVRGIGIIQPYNREFLSEPINNVDAYPDLGTFIRDLINTDCHE